MYARTGASCTGNRMHSRPALKLAATPHSLVSSARHPEIAHGIMRVCMATAEQQIKIRTCRVEDGLVLPHQQMRCPHGDSPRWLPLGVNQMPYWRERQQILRYNA